MIVRYDIDAYIQGIITSDFSYRKQSTVISLITNERLRNCVQLMLHHSSFCLICLDDNNIVKEDTQCSRLIQR